MKGHTHAALARLALVAVVCGTTPALAGYLAPSWRFYKPSNTGIPGDFIHTLYIDELDRPWVAAYVPQWEEGGMARHEGNNVWTTISNVDHPVIPSHFFNDIVADADGIMWIGTDGGLLRYDPDVGPDSFVVYDTSNTPMPANPIFGVEIDPNGKIWLAIDDVQGAPFGGLVRFDPVAETWDVWTTASGLPWGHDWPGWDWVDWVAAQPDASGGFTIWFGSYEMGTATYKDGAFFWYGNTWPPADPMTPTGLPSNDPVDDDGNLWIVLWAGLAKRAPDGTYQVVGYPGGLDNEVSCIYAASGGRAVLGTYMGTAYVWDSGWSFLGDWGGSYTLAFDEDSTGGLWVGGIGGVARYENGTMTELYRLTNTGMLGYFIEAISFGTNGDVHMSANAAPGVGGYDIFHGDRWTCVNDANYGLGPPWGLPADNVPAICERSTGTLVISPYGQGVLEWDGLSYEILLPQGYSPAYLAEDGLGRIWATADYGHTFLLDGEGGWQLFNQSGSPLPSGSIGEPRVDPVNPGYIYIPAQSGVAHTNGDVWNVITGEALGFQFSSIRCVDLADDGTLWIGSDLGIAHHDPATGATTIYDMTNTTLPSNEIDHVTIAPDGSVWMSTFDSWYPYPGGVTVFDGETWTTFTEENSPLPLEQLWDLESRAIPGGYEIWVGTAGEAIAVLTVSTPVLGDVDGDGTVGITDLLDLLAAWGACADCGACPADLDRDCAVGVTDLLMLLANWG